MNLILPLKLNYFNLILNIQIYFHFQLNRILKLDLNYLNFLQKTLKQF